MNQYAQSAKFSDMLSSIPEPAAPTLTRLAQQYKNDAITLSLIMHEKNRRDRTRNAMYAQQGGQPQPKVNDAVVAELMQQLPEDVGIGQLATPNMDRMYDGGLVSFAGGGEVDRYQNKGTVDGASESSSQFLQDLASIPGAYEKWWLANREEDARKEETERRIAERKKQVLDARQKTSFANYLFGSPEREAQGSAELAQLSATPLGATARSGSMPEKGYTRPGMLYDPRLNTPAPAQNQMGAKVPPSAAPGTIPATGGPAQPQMTAPTQTAAQRYAEMQKALEPDRAAMNKGIAALSERMRTTAKGELEDYDKEVAERGVAFKGREERIGKREEELTKRKTDLGNFALLEFGLGLMSEPGSFAQAVGRVGQTTVKNYSSGLKDLRAAQEKLDDARDQIEEFRRNEANMTAKERRQFKSAISRTEIEIEKLGVRAAEQMYGNKREDIKNVFTADTQERLTGMEISSRERTANAQLSATLNTPDRLVFNQLLKDNGNNAAKAAEALQKMKAEKFNMYEAYSKYLTGFAGKETMTPPMDFDQFASKFMVPTTKNPGKGATILTQP